MYLVQFNCDSWKGFKLSECLAFDSLQNAADFALDCRVCPVADLWRVGPPKSIGFLQQVLSDSGLDKFFSVDDDLVVPTFYMHAFRSWELSDGRRVPRPVIYYIGPNGYVSDIRKPLKALKNALVEARVYASLRFLVGWQNHKES